MPTLNVDYPGVLDAIRAWSAEGRTESHSFLLWFLENYYRLDDVEAQDAVCDGPDDKGIDGMYVNENLESIDVFQSKLVQNASRTLGDTQLKEFVGTLSQLSSPEKIEELRETTSNTELSKLLESEKVATRVQDGYAVRGIFVTNIAPDEGARAYLSGQNNIRLFGKPELESEYIPTGPTEPVDTPVTFDVFGFDRAEYQVGDVRVVFAPLKGSELTQLEGIASSRLFAWNVRGSLGRTKVNKDISRSIDELGEHKNFLLYHNGITILCGAVDTASDEDRITISKYSVVNGCQSLVSLFENKNRISNELRIMVRLIALNPNDPLVERITHHSNNQNSINARDLQSNSTIQRRLQSEFQRDFGTEIFYRIKRGEPSGPAKSVIENDEAGRLLLAFDLKQPWTCHQSYKVFDELYGEIFARPGVTARRIAAINEANSAVSERLTALDDKLLASYRLTRYFLLYLVREALELDGVGRAFCRDPSEFVADSAGRARLSGCLRNVVEDVIIDVNAVVKERADANNPIDHKRELKSPNAVRELQRNIIPVYQKAIARGRVNSFGTDWEEG